MSIDNAFAMLGVTTRDDRARIMEAADERSLSIDADACSRARATLTNPRRRIDAELAWFPGASPTAATIAYAASVADAAGLPLDGLAKANALSNASKGWTPASVRELVRFLDELAAAADDVDTERLLREINEDRDLAGFSPIPSVEVLEEPLRDRRRAWRDAALDVMDRSPAPDMAKAVSALADRLAEEDRFTDFAHELLADYGLRAQPFLSREAEGARLLIDRALEFASSRPDALPPLLAALERLLDTWSMVTHPNQLSCTLSGTRDAESDSLASAARELSVSLFNDHGLLREARQVSAMVGAAFEALPAVAAQNAEDARALENLASQSEQHDEETAYSATIGMFGRSRLSIDRHCLEWRGRRTAASAVKGVRWGAVRKSMNGIPTGTDYLVAWRDGGSTTTVEFGNGAIYEAFVPRLWRTVGVRLLDEMVERLAAGAEMSFGEMKVRDRTVILARRKMLSRDAVECNWAEVSVSSSDGAFVVHGPKGSKASASASYRDVENVHLLEILVRRAFERGTSSLSDAFA